MSPDWLEPYRHLDTVCHRLSPRLKIILAFCVMLVAVLLPVRYWPAHGCLASLIFAAHALARIPLRYILHRVLLLLPSVVMVGLSVPLSTGFTTGWEVCAGVIVRSLLAFTIGLWLVHTTPFEQLLAAAQSLGMPRLFAVLLAFMYRYVFVLFDELQRMRTARRARSFGSTSIWKEWLTTTQLLGQLLIRALDRAERVHGAMCARGWQGRLRSLDEVSG